MLNSLRLSSFIKVWHAKSARMIIGKLILDAQDLLYEEELMRNPFSLKMW